MRIYDFLFYKLYLATRIIDQSQNPKVRMTFLGPIWVLSILEGFFLVCLYGEMEFLLSIHYGTKFISLTLCVFAGFFNCIYFILNKRWKRIVDGYSKKKLINQAFTNTLIVVGIVVYLVIIFIWVNDLRDRTIAMKYTDLFQQ